MGNKALYLDIVSPEKEIFKGEITSVTLPGAAGSFTILPHHAPIVSILNKGTIRYVSPEGEKSIDIEGGFVEMSNNAVSICIS